MAAMAHPRRLVRAALHMLALLRAPAAMRAEADAGAEAGGGSRWSRHRTLCERAWQLEQIFPTGGPGNYADFAVRKFAGATLEENKFVAIRSVRLTSVDARVAGSFQDDTFDLQVWGESSCTEAGGPAGDCAVLQLKVVDLDLHKGMPGSRDLDSLSLDGENEIVVSMRVTAHVHGGGQSFGRPRAPDVEFDELYVNVLKLGDSFINGAVIRRAMNSGVVADLMRQGLTKSLVELMAQSDELAYFFIPGVSISARLVPPPGGACPPPLSCIEVADVAAEFNSETASMLQPANLNRLLGEKMGPLGAQLRERLGPCCGDGTGQAWRVPPDAAEALGRVMLWNRFRVVGAAPPGQMLGHSFGADSQLSVGPLLRDLRDIYGFAARPAFLGRHPEDGGQWVTLGMKDPAATTSLAVRRPHLKATGALTLRNTESDDGHTLLLEVDNTLIDLGAEGMDCAVAEAYVEKWVGDPSWEGFNMCAVLGKATKAQVEVGRVTVAVNVDTGEVSLCLQQPCAGRSDLAAPEIRISASALPAVPEVLLDHRGGWDMTVDLPELLQSFNENVNDAITHMEATRGPFPPPEQVREALESGEMAGCKSSWVAGLVKDKIADNILGRNLKWTPGEKFAVEQAERMQKLHEAHVKPGYRFVVGRIARTARRSGVVDIVAWQDEGVRIPDARLYVVPATRERLDELEPGLEGEYIIDVQSSTGGPVELTVTLMNPESSDMELSGLFNTVSTETGSKGKRFEVIINFQLTMVLHKGKLNACIGGACCSKSVELKNLKFGGSSLAIAIANKVSGLATSLLQTIASNMLGHTLPKFIQPLVEHSLGVAAPADGAFRSFEIALHVSSEVGDSTLRIEGKPQLQEMPARPGGGGAADLRARSIHESKLPTWGIHQGVLQLVYNPLTVLAKTLLRDLDFSVAAESSKLSIPFSVAADSNLDIQVSMPSASTDVLLSQLLRNLRIVAAQPPQFWDDRAADFGLPAAAAEESHGADPCGLKRPGPSESRRLNRAVDFSSPFDGGKAIRSADLEVNLTVTKRSKLVHGVRLHGAGSLSVDLDVVLPTVSNDPGSTDYNFADYDAGTFKTYWMGMSSSRAVRVVCGWLSMDNKPAVDLLTLGSGEPATIHGEGEAWELNVGGGHSLYGEEAGVRGLAQAINREVPRQRFNWAAWDDAGCAGRAMGPTEATAFSACDAHVTGAFRWEGEVPGGQEAQKHLGRCQDACGAHPPCRSVSLLGVHRVGLPDTWVCTYSPNPGLKDEGLTKEWLVSGP